MSVKVGDTIFIRDFVHDLKRVEVLVVSGENICARLLGTDKIAVISLNNVISEEDAKKKLRDYTIREFFDKVDLLTIEVGPKQYTQEFWDEIQDALTNAIAAWKEQKDDDQ